jgi:hypothetical protein
MNCKVIYCFPILILLFNSNLISQEKTIYNYISPPEGYTRIEYNEGTFSNWIQSQLLKGDNTILKYNGDTIKQDFYNVFGVVKMPLLFTSNLEQCADYCMRFWAEFHRSFNTFDKLYLFDYNGKRKYYNNSNRTFRSFLKQAFAYSNSHSLKKGCKSIVKEELTAGDLIVQNETSGTGHVSMIMDICESEAGKKLYLIGYSFMPAQEFHIEKATDNYGAGGWFTLEGYFQYLSNFLNFGKPVLRRFEPIY